VLKTRYEEEGSQDGDGGRLGSVWWKNLTSIGGGLGWRSGASLRIIYDMILVVG